MAPLVGISANAGAILAAHVALQFVDWCGFRPADDIECDRLVGIAAKAADLKVAIASVQGVANCRGRLRRSLVAEHPEVPGLASQHIGSPASLPRAFGRGADRAAVNALSGFGGHGADVAARLLYEQAARCCRLIWMSYQSISGLIENIWSGFL